MSRLLLSSVGPSVEHDAALAALVGMPIEKARIGYIENAYDVYDDPASLQQGRDSLVGLGYRFELVDLRDWRTDRAGLRTLLEGFDALLLTGGNPFYLRWLMKVTGADAIVTDLVAGGTVYAAASAAAVVAGPTLRHFDELDDPSEATEVIWDGLGLTQVVVAPHIDNPEFGAGCRKAADLLENEGYEVIRITDHQALVIDDDRRYVVGSS